MKFNEATEYLTEKLSIKKFKDFSELFDFLDAVSQLKKFRQRNAEGEDAIWEIPLKDWKKIVGWSESDIKKINKGMKTGSGIIYYDDTDEMQVNVVGPSDFYGESVNEAKKFRNKPEKKLPKGVK